MESCTATRALRAQVYAARKVLIYTPDRGHLLEEVSLDPDSYYPVSLPPGCYHVDISYTGIDISADGLAGIEFRSRETTSLDICLDTAVR